VSFRLEKTMSVIFTAGNAPIVSTLDQERLVPLIEGLYRREHSIHMAAGTVLRRLRTAHSLPPAAIPANLVTMNSTVVLVQGEGGEKREVTLVYPEDHDPAEGCWSVLSPLGAALFGLRVGDALHLDLEGWQEGRWQVAEMPFQPESRGWLSM